MMITRGKKQLLSNDEITLGDEIEITNETKDLDMSGHVSIEIEPEANNYNKLTQESDDNTNHQSSRIPFMSNKFTPLEMFETFYEDYIDFKRYMNDVINSIKDIKKMNNENDKYLNTIHNNNIEVSNNKMLNDKIASLIEENEKLKNDNSRQLKVIENLSIYRNSDENSWKVVEPSKRTLRRRNTVEKDAETRYSPLNTRNRFQHLQFTNDVNIENLEDMTQEL